MTPFNPKEPEPFYGAQHAARPPTTSVLDERLATSRAVKAIVKLMDIDSLRVARKLNAINLDARVRLAEMLEELAQP